MKLYSHTPQGLSEQVSDVIDTWDDPTLAEQLEIFVQNHPDLSAFFDEDDTSPEKLIVLSDNGDHWFPFLVLRALLNRPDLTDLIGSELYEGEKYIEMIKRISRADIFEVCRNPKSDEGQEIADEIEELIINELREMLLMYAYLLLEDDNEDDDESDGYDSFASQCETEMSGLDDDGCEYLDRGEGVNISEAISRKPGDWHRYTPDWKGEN